MSAAIIGREDELAAIRQFLSRDDWPRTLLLEGEAGAGKTTLWQDAVDSLEGTFHVLLARPLEPEAKLAHSGVGGPARRRCTSPLTSCPLLRLMLCEPLFCSRLRALAESISAG